MVPSCIVTIVMTDLVPEIRINRKMGGNFQTQKNPTFFLGFSKAIQGSSTF